MPVARSPASVGDRQNQYAPTLCDISDRVWKALEDEAANSRPPAQSRPNGPHSGIFGNDFERAGNLAQKHRTETRPLCFVPVGRVVQVADGPWVELDSQSLARSQSKLDSSAYFGPVFELCGSVDRLARAPIKLFQPCRSGVGICGFIEALNQFRRQPRALASGQPQKLGKNFATVRHRNDRSAVSAALAMVQAVPSGAGMVLFRGCDGFRTAIPSCARYPSRSRRAAPSRSGASRGTIQMARAADRAK